MATINVCRGSEVLGENDMIDFKSPANTFEAIALLLGPIRIDAVAVGNFSTDVINQALKRFEPTTLSMGDGVDVGMRQKVQVVADVLSVGLRESGLLPIDQQA